MIELARVQTQEHISVVVKLAHEIWKDHYVPIIGQEQVDYMLDMFQSDEAVTAQLADGHEYYIISHDGHPVGYMAIVPDEAAGKVMISKIYVRKSGRGRGFGRAMLDFTEQLCRKR